MTTTTLVTGVAGLLGPWLTDAARRLGEVRTTSRSAGDVPADLADEADVRRLVAETRPDVVLHVAGVTDVDLCQRRPDLARRGNHEPSRLLAAHLPEEALFVYVSTDQVYPDTAGPHVEGSEAPVNAYGASKLAGEQAALARHARTLVIRTNFFGPSQTPGRSSISDVFAEAFVDGRPLSLFTDVLFSPLHMATLASLTVELVARRVTGCLNLGSRDGMSKHDFALLVADTLGLSTRSTRPGLSTDVPGRAPRPRDLRLDVTAAEGILGRRLPSLAEEVRKLCTPSR